MRQKTAASSVPTCAVGTVCVEMDEQEMARAAAMPIINLLAAPLAFAATTALTTTVWVNVLEVFKIRAPIMVPVSTLVFASVQVLVEDCSASENALLARPIILSYAVVMVCAQARMHTALVTTTPPEVFGPARDATTVTLSTVVHLVPWCVL